jgi:FAD/FMN-containing dehydrogenase
VNERSPTQLLEDLRAAVGPAHVLADAGLRAGYEVDWTGRWRGEAVAVVRPGSAEEVAAVVVAAAANRAAVVVQGGNTGLVGGGIPRPPGHPALGGRPQVVVSTRRLRYLEPVDGASRTVVAGAGVTLAEVRRRAAGAGLEFGVDLAARDSATVGGLISTDAGGIHVLRHGRMADQVVELEVVLAHGAVVRWPDDDRAAAAIGTEGTLAIVTAARLRLVPRATRLAVAIVGLESVAAAVDLVARVRAALPELRAAELILEPGVELVRRHLGLAGPLAAPAPTYLLLELGDDRAPAEPGAEPRHAPDPAGTLARTIADLGGAVDAVLADDAPGRERLWRIREAHAESIAAAARAVGSPVHKLDVSLPLPRLAEFVERAGPAAERAVADARTIVFGHLAEGDLHVNVLGIPADDASADEAILGLVVELGGSVAAEHGVGIAKVAWRARELGPAGVAAERDRKARLDPADALTPGVGPAGSRPAG